MNPSLLKTNTLDNSKKGGVNLRLKKLYAKLEHEKLDGLLLGLPANISYLTDYLSRDSYLVVSKKGNVYITDSRYTQEAKAFLKGIATVTKINGSAFQAIAEICQDLSLRSVGFEGRYLPFAEHQKIRQYLNKNIELVSTHSLVEELRQIKDKDELKKIKEAVRITLKALDFIQELLTPELTEIEVAAELERFIRYNGASASAFEIIVASGPHAAYPHHITSQRKLRNNEPVLIDLGVDYAGYKSDLTRVFFLGKITFLARKAYGLVKEAKTRAIKAIKPGALISEIDAKARQYLRRSGYADFFGHNLGHGVGLEVHEAPTISPKEHNRLEPGMVFTVEPGIYLPGKFGIRIEDMVLVTAKGVEVLSGAID